jgi:hypothetical protein
LITVNPSACCGSSRLAVPAEMAQKV